MRFWEISRQAAVTLARPTSRAQRFEFSGGFQNISYDAEGRIEVYSGVTGEFLGEERYDIDTPDSLNLGMGSAAMVYDASVFGGTSPIMGLRYRMEAGISGGSLTFSTLLVDYRRYARIAGPLSLAGRVLHYGRYGGDSEDGRLSELSLGYPSLVRGYEPGSFSPKECAPGTGGELSCPTFDRIFGSRLLVGNVEARLQTLGPLGIIPSRSFPPVETAIFYDAGLAWRSKRISSALGIPRRPVSSWGGSLRFNAMGFFIAQLSYVHANDRPARRWGGNFRSSPAFSRRRRELFEHQIFGTLKCRDTKKAQRYFRKAHPVPVRGPRPQGAEPGNSTASARRWGWTTSSTGRGAPTRNGTSSTSSTTSPSNCWATRACSRPPSLETAVRRR